MVNYKSILSLRTSAQNSCSSAVKKRTRTKAEERTGVKVSDTPAAQ